MPPGELKTSGGGLGSISGWPESLPESHSALLTDTKEGIDERENVAFGVDVDAGPPLSMISISSQTLLRPQLGTSPILASSSSV